MPAIVIMTDLDMHHFQAAYRTGIQDELVRYWSKLLEPIPAREPGLISRLWLRTPC